MLCSVYVDGTILAVYVGLIAATLKFPPFDHSILLDRSFLTTWIRRNVITSLHYGYVFLPVEFRVKSNSANIRQFGVNARRNKYIQRTRNLHGTS